MLRQLTSLILLSALSLTTISQNAFALHSVNSDSRRSVDATGKSSNHSTDKSRKQSAVAFSRLPVTFEANHGQSEDKEVNFVARNIAAGYSLLLKPAEAVFVFSTGSRNNSQPRQSKQQSEVLQMKLQGANNAAIEARGLEPQASKINYLRGNDSRKWQTGVETYSRVEYKNVYQGIDLQYYGRKNESSQQEQQKSQQLEYDFIMSPEADYKQIKLRFNGASKVEIEPESGDLLLRTKAGVLRQHRPIVYQESERDKRNGEGKQEREIVESRYVKLSKNEVGFAIGEYDKTRQLVIDPVIAYSSYLGGIGDDRGTAIAVDSTGSTYITGSTNIGFPTKNPFQPTAGGLSDAFITKIDASGQLVYSTYLGGSGFDSGRGIAVDSTGNAYVTGSTSSTNFPTRNALQPAKGGGDDVFITKIDISGQQLLYSTYLGGGSSESGSGIKVDAAGNTYITGVTHSNNFPISNALQPIYGGGSTGAGDAFVTKVNSTGQQVLYSTYLGGSNDDQGSAIAIDSAENVYVTGGTFSTDFPISNALQSIKGSSNDVFVTKINPSGQQIIFSTYLGGNSGDTGNSIAVDSVNDVYITGGTSSTNFPTRNPLQPTYSGGGAVFASDAFVAKINASGQQLVFSTYLGGNSSDYGYSIAVDFASNAYVTGITSSTNFPTRNAFQPTYGGGNSDAFVTKINANGQQFIYSTYLGGGSDYGPEGTTVHSLGKNSEQMLMPPPVASDSGYGIAVDSAGNAYVTGITSAISFPTRNALQQNKAGALDGFVTKITNPAAKFDFDGDGRADLSVFRPSDSIWYLLRSTQGFSAAQFGLPTDKIAPADYDGDGRTDIAVFRNGAWYWLNSSNNTFNATQFGQAGDVPAPADYTGDGRAELAVYRAGVWYTLNLANNQFQATQWGSSTDIIVPADYDGDGKTDVALYRPSNGTWYWLQSSNGAPQSLAFGTAATPVVGDYDGDGRADPAVYLEGRWYLARSTAGFTTVPFGVATDRPVPADYDGDGKTDIAIYRDGVWWLQQSERGLAAVQFGTANDQPIPVAFMP